MIQGSGNLQNKMDIEWGISCCTKCKGDMGMMFVINQPGIPELVKSKICNATVGAANRIIDPITNRRTLTVYVVLPQWNNIRYCIE